MDPATPVTRNKDSAGKGLQVLLNSLLAPAHTPGIWQMKHSRRSAGFGVYVQLFARHSKTARICLESPGGNGFDNSAPGLDANSQERHEREQDCIGEAKPAQGTWPTKYSCRSSAGPGAALGSPSAGAAPALPTAQTLATAGHDPVPGRGRLRIEGVGVFSSGGSICQLLIRCLSRSLRRIRVTRSGRAFPWALARACTGRNRARPSRPSHSVLVGPAPGP